MNNTITLPVKRIPNVGQFGEYPALRNTKTGAVYADVTLGIERFLAADKDGLNMHGEFVGFNIPGNWHTFKQEPECHLRREVVFDLQAE